MGSEASASWTQPRRTVRDIAAGFPVLQTPDGTDSPRRLAVTTARRCIPASDHETCDAATVNSIEGRPLPKQQLSIRLPHLQVEELDRVARSAGCLRSDVVRQALSAGLRFLTAPKDQETT